MHSVNLSQAARMWPTPTVPNGGRAPKGGMSPTGMTPDGKKRQADLQHSVRMVASGKWTTPTAMNNTGGPSMSKWGGAGARAKLRREGVSEAEINGALNPTWVEWLMGYPLGWTALEGWETRSSRKSSSGSGGESSRPKRGRKSHD